MRPRHALQPPVYRLRISMCPKWCRPFPEALGFPVPPGKSREEFRSLDQPFALGSGQAQMDIVFTDHDNPPNTGMTELVNLHLIAPRHQLREFEPAVRIQLDGTPIVTREKNHSLDDRLVRRFIHDLA